MREVLATMTLRSGRRWGQIIIEHLFYLVTAKHNRSLRRLRPMQAPLHPHRPLRPAAEAALRTALWVALAMLSILVLLPALLAAQTATI